MENNLVQSSNKTKVMVLNGFVAAIYVAVAALFPGTGVIQFRLAEGLNHLVVFNRKLIWGVLGGVMIYNFFFSTLLDVVFGGGQTLLCLLIITLVGKYVKNVPVRLALNVLLFAASMCIIVWMIQLSSGEALPFWETYGVMAMQEALVMTITAPVMYGVDKAVHFERLTK